MNNHDPTGPGSKPRPWKVSSAALVIGALALAQLIWMTCPPKAASQDLLTELAVIGIRAATGTLTTTPRCVVGRESTAMRRLPPPSRDVNVLVYPVPAPPPRRTMDVEVWPEPQPPRRSMEVSVRPERVAKPVGTYTSGGYVLNGATPAQQPASQPVARVEGPRYPSPAEDISPTQEQLRGR
jgi:hypothetical protein